jgi:hypothetical protein
MLGMLNLTNILESIVAHFRSNTLSMSLIKLFFKIFRLGQGGLKL